MKALVGYVALTVLFTFPLSIHPGRLQRLGPDGNLFIWTIAWDAHAFVHQPLAIFDANIYFPERHTLAYSENLIGSAITALPVLWVTGDPVLAVNLVALLSVVLCGFGTYLLARRLGLGASAAFLAGLVFAFSPPRFFRLGQAHLTVMQWIPFSLAYLHAYLDTGRPRDLRIAIAFFTAQALSSGHGAAFLAIASLGLVVYRLVRGLPLAIARRARDAGVVGVLLLLPVVLMLLPYRAVQDEMQFRRDLNAWGINPASFLASPSHLWSWVLAHVPGGARINEVADAYLFPGLLTLALAIAALAVRSDGSKVRRSEGRTLQQPSDSWTFGPPDRRGSRDAVFFYTSLTLLCVWLAIGPPFGLWQFVYWLPGFNLIREASRFTILGMLGLAILAGFGFERLTGVLVPARRALAAGVVGVLLVAEFAAFPFDLPEARLEMPAVDRWLDGQPKPFAIAEVPLPNPQHAGPFERRQTEYMLHSMAHWQKTVNGYSGFRPELHNELYRLLRSFPDEASVARLEQLGVRYVVVHTDLYEPGQWPDVESRLAAFGDRITLVHLEGPGRIYQLSRGK